MDEFWRFSKLRKVNLWYIREKGIYEGFSSMEQDLKSFGLRLKFWLWKV